jgi:tryptophan 2,3-dioxygenase
VGTYFYDDLVRPRLDREPACPPDVLVAVLLADLLLEESTSLLALGGSDGTPVMHLRARRVTTLATALSHNRADLLQRDEVLPLWPAARRKGDRSHVADAEAGKRLAERFLAVAPPRVHRFAQLALVPATDVYDEPMFLRVLQLFETMFGVVLGLAGAARDDLVAGRTEAAVGRLDAARVTMGRAIPFFRILATMPKESFAVIRQFTAGASGLQSESFKAIEVLCAQPADDRLAGPGYEAPVVARLAAVEQVTLDKAIRAALPSVDTGAADRLVASAAELDHEWMQWKRTHWAIANRLIGDVPGTGGTDGATYLRRHMSGPLLPFLHEEDD